MNTALAYTRSIEWFGFQRANNRLHQSIGSINGYGWLALFNPRLESLKEWIVPLLNFEVFSLLLEDFAEHFGLGEQKRVILVLDQAAFHTSRQVRVPEGIHLLFLPSKSPELQPAERLWTLTNEAITKSLSSTDFLSALTF